MNNTIKRSILFLIIFTLSISIIFVLNKKIKVKTKMITSHTSTKYLESNPSKDSSRRIDMKQLQKQYNNSDIVGKLHIPDTNINELVVQTVDNDYYLNHNEYKQKDEKGSVFLDYRTNINNSKKLIIYGHNSYQTDIAFKELEKYYNEKYFLKHKYIYLEDENNLSKYEIFSIYIEAFNWYYTKINFKTEDEWLQHLNWLKSKSWYKTNINLSKEDKILLLQTCSHHNDYKNYKNKYLLVIGKKINQ